MISHSVMNDCIGEAAAVLVFVTLRLETYNLEHGAYVDASVVLHQVRDYATFGRFA